MHMGLCVCLPNTPCTLSNQRELGPAAAEQYLADDGLCPITGCGSPGSVIGVPGSVIAEGQGTSPAKGQWRGRCLLTGHGSPLRLVSNHVVMWATTELGWSVRGHRQVPAPALRRWEAETRWRAAERGCEQTELGGRNNAYEGGPGLAR